MALHGYELTLDELLKATQQNLSADGTFFLLFPYKRKEEIKKAFEKYKLIMEQIIFVRQSVNHDYFRMMIMGNKNSNESDEITFDEISVWGENQQYTKEFVELLKDYYLHL